MEFNESLDPYHRDEDYIREFAAKVQLTNKQAKKLQQAIDEIENQLRKKWSERILTKA